MYSVHIVDGTQVGQIAVCSMARRQGKERCAGRARGSGTVDGEHALGLVGRLVFDEGGARVRRRDQHVPLGEELPPALEQNSAHGSLNSAHGSLNCYCCTEDDNSLV